MRFKKLLLWRKEWKGPRKRRNGRNDEEDGNQRRQKRKKASGIGGRWSCVGEEINCHCGILHGFTL